MRTRGLALAVAAYVAWGFLSPVGQLLLESMGPFTLNALRTIAALPLLFLISGRHAGAAVGMLRRPSAWVLGAVWLVLTFAPYHASLSFLPPTITTLTIYLAPFIVAGWEHLRGHERMSPLLIPTILVTVGGAWLATQGPGGVPPTREGALGLALALTGVAGWAGYTIHLKRLTATADANALTLAAFLTSGVAFLALALPIERLEVTWSREVGLWLAFYVLVPTFLSFWIYGLAIRWAPAGAVATLIGAELVATAVVSAVVRDEVFTTTKVVGLLVVTAAVTAYLLYESRRGARQPAGQ